MSIIKAFQNAQEKKDSRGWDRIYVFVDLHETVIKPTYEDASKIVPYENALDVLTWITKNRLDIWLVIYSCSWAKDILEYLMWFKSYDIRFQYVNKTEEPNTEYACFDRKPYYNVLLDDKAGFDPETDWLLLKEYFKIN